MKIGTILFTAMFVFSAMAVQSAEFKIEKKANIKAEPFSAEDVQLLDGPFLHARDLDATYLLSLEADRLLAGDLGPDSEPEPGLTPVIVTNDRPISEWIKRAPGKELSFQTINAGRPDELTLIPFYKMHHRRYGVYWDLFTEEEWQKHEADYRAEQERQRELEARTVDVMRIGEMQPERNHNLQSEHSSAGEAYGRKWRHAENGGWFSFELKSTDGPCELICTYWRSDSENRVFDILINGTKIAEQTLDNNEPDQFFDVAYPVPEELRKGNEKITVQFQAHPGAFAGGLFGCRLVKMK